LRARGKFWDVNAYKRTIGRIRADDVVSWPRTSCAAWGYLDERRVDFAAEWESGGAAGFHRQVFGAFDQADVVVGHNMKAFDLKHLRTAWIEHDLGEPSPFMVVDTLSIARNKLGAESKSLDALTKRFGIPSRVDHYSVEVAEAAVNGSKADQRKLERYNKGDIRANQALLKKLIHLAPLPHASLYDGESKAERCRCGSFNLRREGFKYTEMAKRQKYQCKDCGRWVVDRKAQQIVPIR